MTLVSTAARGSTSSGSGAIASLFNSTLSVGAATIDTGAGGIAQTANHLLIVAMLRSDQAATVSVASVTFNNDSGANYFTQSSEATATVASGVQNIAATSINLEDVSAASSPASIFTPVTLFVPSYASTAPKKSLNGLAGYRTGSAGGNLLSKAFLGYWDSTAAITRLAFVCTGGNFVAGSTVTVYGLT